MIAIETRALARKRTLWEGNAAVQLLAEQADAPHGVQRLKNLVETDIVARFVRGVRVLDVGIGVGRISFPLLRDGLRLTGVDASAAMIERCRGDERSAGVQLMVGELQQLPFAREAFDTVISVDTFAHCANWSANLDELLRVTAPGGRVIVDVDSLDHLDAVARLRGCGADTVDAEDRERADAFAVRLTAAELRAYAVERGVTLSAIVPYGLVLGSLVPNHWLTASFAYRSGGIDRLVSWTSTDPRLAEFACFLERRIVQQLSPTACSRMFVVIERSADATAQDAAEASEIPERDERGADAWHAELVAHVEHEPNRAFALALLLAARPVRLPASVRDRLPDPLALDIVRAERACDVDEAAGEVARMCLSGTRDAHFHGVDLRTALAAPLASVLRDALGSSR